MLNISPYITLLRPLNAIMSIVGVALGFWIADGHKPLYDLLFLFVATICALGYGNVINDIKDCEGDAINHPQRPLPQGKISKRNAFGYALLLAVISLAAGFGVSKMHGIAVLAPIMLLTLYTLSLKNTPLIGNILISLLVAYTLIFGGIGSARVIILIVPAVLAFQLNLCREIVKDIQDKTGDMQTGVRTTALLPDRILKTILLLLSLFYIPLVFAPVFLAHFGFVYLAVCVIIVLPIHLYWTLAILFKKGVHQAKRISALIKVEMIAGLAALAVDYWLYL